MKKKAKKLTEDDRLLSYGTVEFVERLGDDDVRVYFKEKNERERRFAANARLRIAP